MGRDSPILDAKSLNRDSSLNLKAQGVRALTICFVWSVSWDMTQKLAHNKLAENAGPALINVSEGIKSLGVLKCLRGFVI